MNPEEELNRVLNDATAYEQTGDGIDAVLTPRGAPFWLGSGRQLARTAGTLRIRLRDGLALTPALGVDRGRRQHRGGASGGEARQELAAGRSPGIASRTIVEKHVSPP